MAHINKVQADQIATLINELQCAGLMLEDCPKANRQMWLDQRHEAIVSLGDDHGIKMPSYDRLKAYSRFN